jgi:hypothetical protein
VSFLALKGCNAPRNNPLDPSGPNSGSGVIEGTVQTISLPYTPLPDVQVYWEPGGIVVKSDNMGRFIIENAHTQDGHLIFSKEGYRTDSVLINWGGNKKVNSHVNLNLLPSLDSIAIYTVIINQFGSFQYFELVVDAKITDRDNDIDSVFIYNKDLGLKKHLNYNVTSKYYQTTLQSNELNIQDIEEIIGLNFEIHVKDIFQKQSMVGSERITRVIKEGSATVFPNADSVSTASPNFSWTRHRVGYPFNYMIEVYSKDFVNPQLINRIENIPSNLTNFQSNINLPLGEYFWVIWVIDNFHNRYRSTPATIVVE